MISDTHTTQGLNSTSLMNLYARAPMTAAGQERDQHADDETPRLRIVEHAKEQLPQPHRIDRQQRQDGAELDQDGEALAEVLIAESRRNCSSSRRWPVDETGTNSVRPSTTPRMVALMISNVM